jgi:hypothetical protein
MTIEPDDRLWYLDRENHFRPVESLGKAELEKTFDRRVREHRRHEENEMTIDPEDGLWYLVELRTCYKCWVEKPLDEFPENLRQCKACHDAYQEAYDREQARREETRMERPEGESDE